MKPDCSNCQAGECRHLQEVSYDEDAAIVQCPRCKVVLQSRSVHDFVSCKCGLIFTDGGNEYARYSMESVVLKPFGKKK